MIPEYKYGVISICIAILSYLTLVRTGYSLFGSILIISAISALAYFYYGHRKIQNKVSMIGYRTTYYLVPNKRKVIFSIGLVLLLLFAVFLIDVITGLGIKSQPPAGTPIGTNAISIFEEGNRLFSLSALFESFGLLLIPAYYLSPFLLNWWTRPKGRKILKGTMVACIILLLFISYPLFNLKRNIADMGDALALMRAGQLEKGQEVCDQATRWSLLPRFENTVPQICQITQMGLRLAEAQKKAKLDNATLSAEETSAIIKDICDNPRGEQVAERCKQIPLEIKFRAALDKYQAEEHRLAGILRFENRLPTDEELALLKNLCINAESITMTAPEEGTMTTEQLCTLWTTTFKENIRGMIR